MESMNQLAPNRILNFGSFDQTEEKTVNHLPKSIFSNILFHSRNNNRYSKNYNWQSFLKQNLKDEENEAEAENLLEYLNIKDQKDLKDSDHHELRVIKVDSSKGEQHPEFKEDEIEGILGYLMKEDFATILNSSNPIDFSHSESASSEVSLLVSSTEKEPLNSEFSKPTIRPIESYSKGYFQNIFNELIKYNYIDPVIELANKQTDDSAKKMILQYISKALVNKIDVKKAIEIAKKVSDDWAQQTILQYISEALADEANIKQVLENTQTLHGRKRKHCIKYIAFEIFFQKGKIDEALRIVNVISDETLKNSAFQYILNALALDKFLEIANIARRHDILNIFDTLAYRNFLKVIKIANMISNDQVRERILREISQILAQYGNPDKAVELAHAISDDQIREETIKSIINILINKDEFDYASKLVRKITDNSVKEVVRQNIHNALVEKGETKKARQVLYGTDLVDKIQDFFSNVFN